MMMKRVMMILVSMLVFSSQLTWAEDRMIWKDMPLIISLVPEKERAVVFPGSVSKVSMLPAQSAMIRTQILGERVFFLTNHEFPKSRIKVVAGGELYLIDLVGRVNGRSDIAYIIDSVSTMNSGYTEREDQDLGKLPAVSLVRHASQTLYAPERLIPASHGQIFKTATSTQPLYFPLFRQKDFSYTFLSEWSGFGYYITAIQVVNHENERINLDPRDIRGQWYARALQHPWLGAKGEPSDSTTVYLVSQQSFINTVPDAFTEFGQEVDSEIK